MAGETFPTGIVTLVFTDIQGSSELWETHGAAFQPVLDEHNRLFREAVARWNGYEVKTEGDAFFLSFHRASDAVRAAVDVQRALAATRWEEVLPELPALLVRIGIHTGEPLVARHPDGQPDYFGPVANRAARVGASGHGGQIVVSEATRVLAVPELSGQIEFSDLGVHRLKGVGEERLWQVRAPDLPAEFPPLKTLSPERHNLPLPLTPFIGREAEIREWSRVVRQAEVRLATLLGFGGMGKTRSALQIAELCIDDFPHGVWWVDLEEVRTGDEMLQRIAHGLRIFVQPKPSVREQIHGFLQDRSLLLVLDNSEQIADAAEIVRDLLAAGPGVKCLVTSRRALELRAERVLEVPPLAPPDAETLFVASARAGQPEFALTPENAEDVSALCRELEYVPLALELAASRIRSMSPREMRTRLNERFRLLQTRAPDLPVRQRALRGTIDWSYDLLEEEEQAVFAQLAVFAGGFTLTAAEAVCEAFDVLESVAELRNHSLLRTELDPVTQATRFVMLETVRSYASEKLRDLPDAAALQERHARYFLRFGLHRAACMHTREELRAIDELSSELHNLRAAAAWARERSDPELFARLSHSIHSVLRRIGAWSEARLALQDGLEAAIRFGSDHRLITEIEFSLADLRRSMASPQETLQLAETNLARRRAAGDTAGASDALNLLGILLAQTGQLEEAQRRFQEALDSTPDSDHFRKGSVLNSLASVANVQGRIDDGRQLYERALFHRRAAGDFRAEAETLNNLGTLAHINGQHEEAERLYREALGLHRTMRDRWNTAVILNNLGELAEITGDLARAAGLYYHAERIFRDLPSVHAQVPAEWLQRLEQRCGPDEWEQIRAAAERTRWEELV